LVLLALSGIAAAACGDDGVVQQPATATFAVTPGPFTSQTTAPLSMETVYGHGWTYPFAMDVTISNLPELGKPFSVTARFAPTHQAEQDAELWITVDGGAYLDGEDRWHGPLGLHEVKTLTATFVIHTEGNHTVVAQAFVDGPPDRWVRGLQTSSPPIQVSVGADASHIGIDLKYSGQPSGVSRTVFDGPTLITDTALLLNNNDKRSVEVIDDPGDIERLQTAGLFPAEMRYSWRRLHSYDFSKGFLIAYFGSAKPTTGHFIRFNGNGLEWDGLTLKANIEEYRVGSTSDGEYQAVSAVVVRAHGWAQNELGIAAPAFTQERSFLVTFESAAGSETVTKSAMLQRGPGPTPVPVVAVSGPAYNFLTLRPSEATMDQVRSGGTFELVLEANLGGWKQSIQSVRVGFSFDPRVLQAVGVNLNSTPPLQRVLAAPAIDNAEGTMAFTISSEIDSATEGNSIVLATITFLALPVKEEVETVVRDLSADIERRTAVTAKNVDQQDPGVVPPRFLGLGEMRLYVEP
jgi:hypothetical protein